MLLRNLDIQNGLTSGAIGTVHDICFTQNGQLSHVLVQFDHDNSLPSITPAQVEPTCIPIYFIEHKYIYKGLSIIRQMLPLILSWASTIHKVQGVTVEACSLDVGSSVFQSGMAYVGLSRVTSLNGLHLLSFNPNSIYANDDVLEEYELLRNKAIAINSNMHLPTNTNQQ